MKRRQAGGSARRSFWFDARFAIGLALVAASVAGVWFVMQAADRTVTVYAAAAPLTVGDTVRVADLVPKQVSLGSTDRLYLRDENLPGEAVVVTRAVAAGELVPASAVGSSAGDDMTRVVISSHSALPASVKAGSLADVWASRQTSPGKFGPPAVLVQSATVVRLVDAQGLVLDRNSVSLELQVPKSEIAAVLEAVANDDALSVVPVAAGLGR